MIKLYLWRVDWLLIRFAVFCTLYIQQICLNHHAQSRQSMLERHWQTGVGLPLGYAGQFQIRLAIYPLMKVLYSTLQQLCSLESFYSSLFPIRRGTRQGCHLSPLLYAISLRQHPLLLPYSLSDTEHCISLYADDILLYFVDAWHSLHM